MPLALSLVINACAQSMQAFAPCQACGAKSSMMMVCAEHRDAKVAVSPLLKLSLYVLMVEATSAVSDASAGDAASAAATVKIARRMLFPPGFGGIAAVMALLPAERARYRFGGGQAMRARVCTGTGRAKGIE